MSSAFPQRQRNLQVFVATDPFADILILQKKRVSLRSILTHEGQLMQMLRDVIERDKAKGPRG